MTARELEILLAAALKRSTRPLFMVPNVSWGFFGDGREVDVVEVRPSRWLVEYEIKVSRADIRADLKKRRRWRRANDHVEKHWHAKIWKTFFAVPEHLANDENIPAYCGVVSVGADGVLTWVRPAKENPKAVKITDADALKLARLGALRLWDAKRKIHELRTEIKTLREGTAK